MTRSSSPPSRNRTSGGSRSTRGRCSRATCSSIRSTAGCAARRPPRTAPSSSRRATATAIGSSAWCLLARSETWIVEQTSRKGSDEAFQELAKRYRGEILLHCYRMLGSHHDAEDAVQETLVRAWRGLDGFEGRASPRAWLYRIATNACLTALAPATGPVRDDRQRALLSRYVRAWEACDVDGFISLLKEDAVWTMPPWREWYVGRPTIKAFISWAWRPERGRRQHLVATAANGGPAFGYYRSEHEASEWRAFAIQVLALQDDTIASVTNFVDARLFAAFGLPPVMPRTPDR